MTNTQFQPYFSLYRILGPINTKKPSQSLGIHIALLRFLGMWPPETDNSIIKTLYNIHHYVYKIVFMYIYTITQALYFLVAVDLVDIVDTLFILMTQISLLYKIEKFHSNIDRIQKIVKKLDSDLFCPITLEEDL